MKDFVKHIISHGVDSQEDIIRLVGRIAIALLKLKDEYDFDERNLRDIYELDKRMVVADFITIIITWVFEEQAGFTDTFDVLFWIM